MGKKRGYFGDYGGRFVPETLMPALEELEKVYFQLKKDKLFHNEFEGLLRDYVGRPTPLYFARRLTEYLGGAKIYLKKRRPRAYGSTQNKQCPWSGSACEKTNE